VFMVIPLKTFLLPLSVALVLLAGVAKAEPITILALGDSLTAGLGLDPSASFPARLEAALRDKGHDVTVRNAGVSGDTATLGAARLDWALTDDVDAAIVELGANDALRGLPVPQAEAALGEILGKLKAKGLPVLLAGMRAPPNLGPDYADQFDGMYGRLAEAYGVGVYPFFLEGVATNPHLNQADGMHPNTLGVEVIVQRILPAVETLLTAAKEKP
jgi:acyl-CoA thioesterase I